MKIKLSGTPVSGIPDGTLDRFRDIQVGGPVTRFPLPPGYRRGDPFPPEFLAHRQLPISYRPVPIAQLPIENPAPIAPPELAPMPAPPVNKTPPRFSGIRSIIGRGRKV